MFLPHLSSAKAVKKIAYAENMTRLASISAFSKGRVLKELTSCACKDYIEWRMLKRMCG